jgi:leucyl aminopeptidase
MNFDIATSEPAQLAAFLQDNEALVVMNGVSAKHGFFDSYFHGKISTSLCFDHHYLKVWVGFLDAAGKKPFFYVNWTSEGNHVLERRWLFREVASRLKTFFSTKKLAVYLTKTAKTAELVMAEDLYFAHMGPMGDANELDSYRVLCERGFDTAVNDEFRSVRLNRLAEFRRWVNENPDEMTSLEMGRRLEAFARKNGCGFEEFDVPRLKSERMNLLLAVGQASDRSPSRLFILTHNYQKGSSEKPLVLIGKGITFDTGGLNVKTHEIFINAMKNDMGGAALMAQTFMALVETGYDKPVILVIPACENLIDKNSVKPGAVITSRAGKKVFIEHTDAEGRLILADALAYSGEHFDPKLTIIAATLTGASLRQFSHYFSGVHFANAEWQKRIADAGDGWGERFSFWQEFLPFAFGNKTKAAELTNMGRLPADGNIGGGSNVAAHFLKEFAKSPLIHMDIFCSTWNWGKDYPGVGFGATGAPFNTLFNALRSQ